MLLWMNIFPKKAIKHLYTFFHNRYSFRRYTQPLTKNINKISDMRNSNFDIYVNLNFMPFQTFPFCGTVQIELM